MTPLVGIDGCRGGWLAALGQLRRGRVVVEGAAKCATLEGALASVLEPGEPRGFAALDMPVGLPARAEPGGRACDRAARQQLGKRKSSVFSCPVRGVLGAADYPEALALQRASSPHGLGLAKQSWFLVPKIREVDAWITPARQEHVKEVHPELAFATLTGAPMEDRKASFLGGLARLRALEKAGVPPRPEDLALERDPEVAADDILDAFALLWVAGRLARGEAGPVGGHDETDARGLAMSIWV
ncbi:MAG: DUF429 domain-containing protein [Myxococcota bacterium]